MPSNNPSPIPAFMAQVNLRDYTGAELFYRHTSATTGTGVHTTNMVAFNTSIGEGIYEDWLDFLNGRGTYLRSLKARLATNKTFPSTIDVGIDGNDRVYIEAYRHNFSVYAHTGSLCFGFSLAATAGASVGGRYRAVATSEWTRGLLTSVATLGILPSTGGYARFSAPEYLQDVQSVPTLIRKLGSENDADDPSNTSTVLEVRDNAENATFTGVFRWWMNDSGHIGWSAPTTATWADEAITWVNTGIRDLLGFSGNEALDNDGNNYSQTAQYPAHASIVPTRPLERITRAAERVDSAVRLTNGRIVGNLIGTYPRVTLDFWIDGPVDSVDLHRHWLERVVPYLYRGQRVSWYGEWGDPRRGLLGLNVTSSGQTYDLLYTSEKDGERGRTRTRVAMSADADVVVEWPSSLRRRAPVTLVLEAAED